MKGEQEIAARLGLGATSRLVKIERVRLTSDEPFALETFYLPGHKFAELVDAPLARAHCSLTLEHDYGVELAYADEEVNATAEGCVAQLLNLRAGARLLRMRQVIYSSRPSRSFTSLVSTGRNGTRCLSAGCANVLASRVRGFRVAWKAQER